MQATRQLAAIMFTDIVGYTALMGHDERTAFAILEQNRAIQIPIIEKYGGRFIKELGDGIMASFPTASDAVFAAMHIQDLCNKEKKFQLRIGIHLGEVVFEKDDVFGDGVNIASRVQSAGKPGTIYISEAVYNNVSNKQDIQSRLIGETRLKNVKEPVRIYEIITPYSKRLSYFSTNKIPKKKIQLALLLFILLLVAGYFSRGIFQKKQIVPSDTSLEKSIAILPFQDISPEKDQAYLGDGLAEEITHSMTIIEGLKVIGTASSSQFKEKNIPAKEIGEKLNVGIVLEGSIQKAGNILRITAQLINVKDNSTIWSQKFDKEMKDIFAIQDTIAKHIVEKLKLTLTNDANSRITAKPTNEEAYMLYLKGVHTYKESKFDKSIEYFNLSISKDSAFAPSYAWMALAKTWQIVQAKKVFDQYEIQAAKDYANRAIRLDPAVAEAYSALALMAWRVELDYPAAKINFEKSLSLNPGSSLIKNRYAYFLLWMGEFDKAIQLGSEAIKLDPGDYNGYVTTAHGLVYKKKFAEAKALIEEGKKLFNREDFLITELVNSFYAGDYKKALQVKIPDEVYNKSKLYGYLAMAAHKTGDRQLFNRYFNQLQTMPEDGNGKYYSLAQVYALMDLADSCFAHLERSITVKETEAKLLKIDPVFKPFHKDARYQDLYRKYGFARYDTMAK